MFSPVNDISSGLLFWLEDNAVLQTMRLFPIDGDDDSKSDGSNSSSGRYDTKQLILADVLSASNHNNNNGQ